MLLQPNFGGVISRSENNFKLAMPVQFALKLLCFYQISIQKKLTCIMVRLSHLMKQDVIS